MVALVVAAVVAVIGGDDSDVASPATSTTIPSAVAFDPETALPVFQTTTDDADEAARQYFASRLPAAVDLRWDVVPTASATTGYVRWELTSSEPPVTGDLFLRVDDGDQEWEVVGAFTDDITITELAHDGATARIEGVLPEDRAAALVVTTVDGSELLSEAIEARRFSHRAAVGGRAAIFRVTLGGDAAFAVTEVRIDGPPR